MSTFLSAFAGLVEHLADLLQPLFHASSAAAAIILFTAFVRLLVHPLSRAAARGQKARAALQPRVAELRKQHAKDPKKLQQAVMALHTEEKVSPLSGCFPSLFQLPAFFLLYHLFSNREIGGEANGLLTHRLFAAPLGERWADALGGDGIFGAAGVVYLGLFVLVAAVATFNYRRMKRVMAVNPVSVNAGGGEAVPGLASAARFMPFMSFFTLFSVAVMPLAAALYMVTSTTWSAVERAVLYRWQLSTRTSARTSTQSSTQSST